MTKKMNPEKKYVLLVIKIQNGEYEYYSYGTHQLDPKVNLNKWSNDYVKDFYGGVSDKDGDWYYFHGGEVAARVSNLHELTKEEYDVLYKYIY